MQNADLRKWPLRIWASCGDKTSGCWRGRANALRFEDHRIVPQSANKTKPPRLFHPRQKSSAHRTIPRNPCRDHRQTSTHRQSQRREGARDGGTQENRPTVPTGYRQTGALTNVVRNLPMKPADEPGAGPTEKSSHAAGL